MSCCDQPGLIPLSDGLKKMLKQVAPLTETEEVALSDAHGRVLAEDVSALAPIPGFDNSAMDGYAIALDSIDIGRVIPIQGKSFAGAPFEGRLKPGCTVRIMTGAAVPEGADCIIMQENTEQNDEGVVFTKLAPQGNNIRRAGEDIASGERVLAAKSVLNPAHVALLASVGRATVPVYRKTRVGLISTGDELKTPGEPLHTGELYNSNGPALRAMLEKLQVDIIDYGILPDDRALFVKKFQEADKACDFVITSGGVSVGEADYTKDVLEEMGDINFWKLAIKPGKPFAFGTLPNSTFIGLPGNPVSAIVTFHILGSQAIRQHQNIGLKPMPILRARTTDAIHKTPGRMDFQRGYWQQSDDGITVALTRTEQGSHILSSLSLANCYIALEKDRGPVNAGDEVTLWLFDTLMSP